jgi:adenylate kinase family enzyme
MTPKTFLFIGRSGAGKGTQAKLLVDHLNTLEANLPVYYLETGAHFREFIKGDSYTSRRAKVMYDNAERMPDFLAIWNWGDLLVRNFTDSMHLIMDGMPRSMPEAIMLRTAFDFYGIKDPCVVYVNVSPDWCRARLKERHRFDDKTEVEIEKKISWFNQDVLPAIEYFRNDPFYKYIEINGEQSIEKVKEEMLSKIQW